MNARRLQAILCSGLLLGCLAGDALAQAFTIRDIRLDGLQRISAGTVFNYLPLKVGDTVDSTRTAEAIRALFRTGFFRDVRIERDGDTLVVSVVERPSIASVEFSGNKDLDEEQLLNALKQVGFAEGRTFDRSVFDQVEQELRRTYFAEGKYAVRITSTITPLERNRVAVNFEISEGVVAKIRQINVVGNEAFDDEDLLDEFQLSTPSMFSFLTKADRYSKQKLAADLETLRSYYLDRGFINFAIDSTQVSITPDKKDVYITVNVTEGDRYVVDEILLQGELMVPEQELFDAVTVVQGEVFSRRQVTQTSELLTERLGNEGYAFANVNAVPEIDDDAKQVTLTFYVDPGKRVYVRRVNFKGNSKTRDEVLRREMRQLEGAWISTGAVERSKERLDRLGFFSEVNVETPAVAGTTDQVDVEFNVVEAASGNLALGAGYSQTSGIILSTSLSQENFLGTGNRFNAVFNNSEINRNISVSWVNPYWTLDGVSRGFDLYSRNTDAAAANLADYNLDEIGAGVTFGIPVSEFDTVNAGFTVEFIDFTVGDDPSAEVVAFESVTGGDYYTMTLNGSWSSDKRDSRLLPSRGTLTRLNGEVALPGGDLQFYKVSASHQRLFPLPRDFVLVLEGEVGYGDGYGDTNELPLTDNYFAGGSRSVRGYESNTLGPRDSKNEPLGGDLKLAATAELVLPLPFSKNSRSFRVTGFIDIGNVYGPNEDFDFGELRYSTGISGIWLSPLGPMSVSLAAPLNSKDNDDTQVFQFNFGTAF